MTKVFLVLYSLIAGVFIGMFLNANVTEVTASINEKKMIETRDALESFSKTYQKNCAMSQEGLVERVGELDEKLKNCEKVVIYLRGMK